jgi:hypothetical protein
MAYATDADHVRNMGNLPDNVEAGFIDVHFPEAKRRLIRWVGQTAYDDACLVTPTDADRAQAIKDAEAHLVIHLGIVGWSERLGPQGNVQSGKDGDSGSFSLKAFSDVNARSQGHLEQAEECLAGYLSDPSPDVHKVEAQDYADEED